MYITCESPKTLRALRLGGRVPVLQSAGPPPPASGRLGGPSGLFIVESVFTCFIMKINLQKYIDSIFIHMDVRPPWRGLLAVQTGCVLWFVTCILFTMRGFLYLF